MPSKPIRDSVRDAFVSFTSPLEGIVPWLYLDIKGLVTVAIGNLVDPVGYALDLPFVRPDGEPASQDQIRAAWQAVKSHTELAQQGYRAAARWTTLRLTDDGIQRVVMAKLDQMAGVLWKRFPGLPEWPADAQLATLSMAWACGPAFHFLLLAAALEAQDFQAAAANCTINAAGNPGIVPRNIANRELYMSAARVVENGMDPDVIWRGVSERPTEPALPT